MQLNCEKLKNSNSQKIFFKSSGPQTIKVLVICMDITFKTSRLNFRLLQETDIEYVSPLHMDSGVRKYFHGGVQSREQTDFQDFCVKLALFTAFPLKNR